MPFITEELWQRLPGVGKDSMHTAYRAAAVTPTVMLAEFPRADESLIDERAEGEMRAVIELVSRVRNIRTELSVKPGEYLPHIFITVTDRDAHRVFTNSAGQIERLTRTSQIFITVPAESAARESDSTPASNGGEASATAVTKEQLDRLAEQQAEQQRVSALQEAQQRINAEAAVSSSIQKSSHYAMEAIIRNIGGGGDPGGVNIPRASARAVLAGGAEVAVPLEGLIDFGQERARIGREREKQEKELQKVEGQLSNPQFVGRAPAEKVEELRQRAADLAQRIKALGEMLEALGE